jgi:hypothetical protein
MNGEGMECLVKWGLVFNDEWIKIDEDFEIEIFHHCIFAFEIQRSFVKP